MIWPFKWFKYSNSGITWIYLDYSDTWITLLQYLDYSFKMKILSQPSQVDYYQHFWSMCFMCPEKETAFVLSACSLDWNEI